MGTPEFAEHSLRRLVEEGFNIVGVVTMPDKPVGRHGSVLQASPVKQYAVSQGIPVLQPERLKDESFLSNLRALNADLQIVVAFRMLPEVVWNMPRLGTFNLHASLLPQYRGAAPINWAVINGDTESGVTTFFLKHEIDTGDIIYQEHVPILDTDDAGSLHDKLMEVGADLIVRTADDVLADRVTPVPQPEISDLRPAPKIFKETCRIDWNLPAVRVHDFVRGLSPYPASWTRLVCPDGKEMDCKIYRTQVASQTIGQKPGTVVRTDGKTYIEVAAGTGTVRILELQLAGKKRMPVQAFLCGFEMTEAHGFSEINPFGIVKKRQTLACESKKSVLCRIISEYKQKQDAY